MADVMTTAQRSYNMSRIRSQDTKPEIQLRNLLISNGISDFEITPKHIPGRPDFYFSNRKTAVFVDGCFWHGCKDCYQAPKTNAKFWKKKVSTNTARDQVVNRELKSLGVKVIRVKEHSLKSAPDKTIKHIESKLSQDQRPKVLDLFAGAGGLSEGFMRAGCEMIGHIEVDKNSCETLTTRMIYHALKARGKYEDYKKYVLGKLSREELVEKYGLQRDRNSVICAEIGKDNYKKLIREIRERLNGQQLDIIVGGPPCQAYSYIGRARDENRMRRDSRNFLYRYYVEFLKAFQPKIFVFENVPGLISAGKGRYLKDMRRLMKKAGYDTGYKILNASDFGVPQSRKRVLLVGWNKYSKMEEYPDFPKVKRQYKVKDFFVGLPKINSGEGKTIQRFSKRSDLLEKLRIMNPEFGLLLDHLSRPNTKQDLEIYRLAVTAKKKGQNIKYNELPRRLKTHRNEDGFLDRFKVVDASAEGSHTIVAHIAKDGHFYIHPDLRQNRSISVREAARLQTFPDDYKFEGTRGPQFRQIGNAVPPMLSEVIARELIKYL